MRVLILGGHGFFGKSLVTALSQRKNYTTIALSRRDGLDLLDLNCTRKFIRNACPDFIVNCAAHVGGLHYVASVPADVLHDNVQMSLNMFRAMQLERPQATIINPLSNCSYPGHKGDFIEHDWLNGDVHTSVYPYGHAKRLLYVASVCYAQQYGMKVRNFLVPNAFGPGDHTDPNRVHALNGMIIRMLQARSNGKKSFEIWGSGKPIREWIYVTDAIDILLQSMELEVDLLNPVNIAQNKGYSIRESAEFIAQAIGFEGEIVVRPELQDGDPKKIMDDIGFRKLFPKFQFMDHFEAIRRTVKYYEPLLSA